MRYGSDWRRSLSSSDQKTAADPKREAAADPSVTPDQIWSSLRTLARQIAIFVTAATRRIYDRLALWLSSGRSGVGAAGAGFARNIRRPNLDLKARVAAWRARSASLWPRLRAPRLRARPLLLSLAVAFVLLCAVILY